MQAVLDVQCGKASVLLTSPAGEKVSLQQQTHKRNYEHDPHPWLLPKTFPLKTLLSRMLLRRFIGTLNTNCSRDRAWTKERHTIS